MDERQVFGQLVLENVTKGDTGVFRQGHDGARGQHSFRGEISTGQDLLVRHLQSVVEYTIEILIAKKIKEGLYRLVEKLCLLLLRKFGKVARLLAWNSGAEVQVVRCVDPRISQRRRGHLPAVRERIQQHPVQTVSSADCDLGLLFQLLEADAPASVLCGLCALMDDEVRCPLQSGVEDIPHPRQIGGETGIVIAGGIDQHAVPAALTQHQQAVDGAVVRKHPSFVLRDERLICERCDDQRRKLVPRQFHHLFDLAVVHLKVYWFV